MRNRTLAGRELLAAADAARPRRIAHLVLALAPALLDAGEVDKQAPLTLPEQVLGDIAGWAARLSVPLSSVIPNDRG